MTVFFNAAGCNSVADINANCGPNSLINNPGNHQSTTHASSSFFAEVNSEKITVEVFPNPASSHTTIYFEELFEEGTVSVLDLTGKTVFKTHLLANAKYLNLNLSTWRDGTYFVKVQIEGRKLVTKKLILMR